MQNSLFAIVVSTIFTLVLVNAVEAAPELRDYAPHRSYYHPNIAAFIAVYYVILCASRWYESDSHVLYEMLWGCNMAMLFSVIAMLTNSPLLAALGGALVTVDQLFWYIDCLGFFLTGCKKFPLGVAAYLLWPTTATMKKITAFHHLWFLPLLLYTLGWTFPVNSFLLSAIVSIVLSLCGRFLTPYYCLLPKPKSAPADEPHKVLYLNINFGYAFWKDIKVKFLHILDHHHPITYIPYVVVAANSLLNLPAFLFLNFILGTAKSYGLV